MSTTLQVQAREATSKGDLRKIRSSGFVPGVVYGKGLDSPTRISVDGKDLSAMLRSHPHAVIEIDIPGAGKHPVMMAELQRDSLSRQVTHIDFRRINMNEKITTSARLDVTGTSPGEKEGGMLQMILHEIEIECYPKDIPDSITVDVSGLEMGENLSISDLTLPSGVEAKQDPETVIIAVLAPQKERTEDEVDAINDETEENRKQHEAAVAVEKDV
ncbi:50S ribosomal protein L25 [Cohnella lupini]|jgi:large subunit ribosomal protein L25|uniref:Large ribosomal subunit protein bL25 n=1 Tax=Cohnella lupini TaxID=1294267 RepID=A0A3D9HQD7_9BACL|nr:50S ribosomal protein L25 [Cohnella lupini]RED51692.1 large subunit ribosomal protein L25 [Cohnella lupini]